MKECYPNNCQKISQTIKFQAKFSQKEWYTHENAKLGKNRIQQKRYTMKQNENKREREREREKKTAKTYYNKLK